MTNDASFDNDEKEFQFSMAVDILDCRIIDPKACFSIEQVKFKNGN